MKRQWFISLTLGGEGWDKSSVFCPTTTSFSREGDQFVNDQEIEGPKGQYTVIGTAIHKSMDKPAIQEVGTGFRTRVIAFGGKVIFPKGAIRINCPNFDEELVDPRTACPNCKAQMVEMAFVDRPTSWVCPQCMQTRPPADRQQPKPEIYCTHCGVTLGPRTCDHCRPGHPDYFCSQCGHTLLTVPTMPRCRC